MRIDPNVAAGAQVQGQFFAAKCRQYGNRNQASRPPIQIRSGPDGAPGCFGDEALEVGIELGGACLRSMPTSSASSPKQPGAPSGPDRIWIGGREAWLR